MELTFNKAYSDLAKLVDEIEDDDIQLDELALKVKHAKVLIDFCETKLRSIEAEVRSVLTDKNKTGSEN
jgi:exodeoxyribonuclease VII small subunit